MSSGEEFEVEEILDERKQKGILEYLVRWQGFNHLYDSWEPATGLADCANMVKAFLEKKKQAKAKAKSRSRSRSRGRPAKSKSKSRSRSRGRSTKSETPKRSRSRSTGRKATKTTRQSASNEVTVTKKEVVPVQEERLGRLRSSASKKASPSNKEVFSPTKVVSEGKKEYQYMQKSVETVQSTKTAESTGMITRSRLAVRQVENDQKALSKNSESVLEEKGTWLWWFADHAVLILFIIVSIIALSFTIQGVSSARDKLIPDMGVLRQRLGESYNHIIEDSSYVFNKLVTKSGAMFNSALDLVSLGGGQNSGGPKTESAPPPAKAA